MTNRFPLILDTLDGNKIKELPVGDNLNLQGSSIIGLENLEISGTLAVSTLETPGGINIFDEETGLINYSAIKDAPVKLSDLENDLETLSLTVLSDEPALAEGTIALADGVNWDPLNSNRKTIAVYIDNQWRNLTELTGEQENFTYFDSIELDSQSNISAQSVPDQLTDTLEIVNTSDMKYFSRGRNLRIYGANTESDNTSITSPPTIVNISAQGSISGSQEVRYRLKYFDFATGKISARSLQSDSESVDFSLFNDQNYVQVVFNRSSSNLGILVYRQRGTGDFALIDVLGQKQLGGQLNNLTYNDYGAFNYTEWSKKNPTFGIYTVDTGLVHFPITAQPNTKKGWVDATVESVDLENNRITLTESYYFEGNVIISHDDTQLIQTAINTRTQNNTNSITLNGRRYIVSSITVPSNFLILGQGNSSNIKKLSWSSDVDNRILKAATGDNTNISLFNFSIDGNLQNQWLRSDSSVFYANYAADFGDQAQSISVFNVDFLNLIGGGISAEEATKVKINLSTIENSGMTDFYEYSPLDLNNSFDITITGNTFKNFTSAIDLSVVENGAFIGNIVQNVGTGVLTFSAKFFVSSQNVLRGPAGEFIPGPDVLNSEFDGINIKLTSGTTFVSDVYTYQENGENFNITNNRAELSFSVDKLRKVDNVEELYGEVLTGSPSSSPIQRIFDVELDPTQGEFKFNISEADVNELLTTYSYSSLKAIDSDHVGLVYSAKLSEYVPSGNITNQEVDSNDSSVYTVTLTNYSNISVGSKVKMFEHGGTPNLDDLVGEVTAIINSGSTITVTIQYDQSITQEGSEGQITVENKFVLAKGRIL